MTTLKVKSEFPNVLLVEVEGKLEVNDTTLAEGALKWLKSRSKGTRLVFVVSEFEGWKNLDSAKADFESLSQLKTLEKVAFVSNEKWSDWVVTLIDMFTEDVESKVFVMDDLEKAWSWAGKTVKKVAPKESPEGDAKSEKKEKPE